MSKRGNGEGSIRERAEGKWEARVSLEGQSRSLYGKTRQEVARKLAAAIRDHDMGLVAPRDERQSVDQFLASWLEMTRPPDISAKTYDRYEEVVRLHIVPTLGAVKLARLTPQQVQELYSSKRDALSPTTVHHIHAVLHTSLQSALRLGLVQRNVCDLVQKPRMGRAEMKTWNPEQAKAFLESAEGDRFHALYVLALSTGMRQGELFGLRWRDVDLDGASLSVVTNLRRSRVAGTELAEPKTRGSRRRITLTPSTVAVLREHRNDNSKSGCALALP